MATVNRNFVIKNGLEVDTNTLYVDATNNTVGIGTTVSDSNLTVQVDANKRVSVGFGTESTITYRTGIGAWFHAGKSSAGDFFEISNGVTPGTTSNIVVTNTNNVGIGVTNPSAKLQIGTGQNSDINYLKIGESGVTSKYYRYVPVPAKATASGTPDTSKTLYIGRFYIGTTKLLLYCQGWGTEEGLEINLHRQWGTAQVPVIETCIGHFSEEITSFHYANIDNETYDVYIVYTYNEFAPIGTINALKIDLTSISGIGNFYIPSPLPTAPTLNTSNQIKYGLVVSSVGTVGVGNNRNPLISFDGFGLLRMSSGASYQSQIISRNDTNDTTGSYFILEKSRAGGPVQNGDPLGTLLWRGHDSNSTLQNSTASIYALAEGTIGAGAIPTGMYFTTSTKYVFTGPNGEVVRINGTGNVGIGTTNPSYKTHILADGDTIALETQSDTGRTAVKFITNGNDWELGARSSLEAIPNSFYIYDNAAASHRFIIRSDGRVGIGSTNPVSTLDVAGTIVGTTFQSANTSSQSLTNGAIYLPGSNGAIIMDDGGHKRISWNDGAGNFNIRTGCYYDGTSLKYAKAPNDADGGATSIILNSDQTSGTAFIGVAAVGTPGTSASWSNSIYLDTTRTYLGSANVGINTDSPNRQLHISSGGECNIVLENMSAGTDLKKSRIYHTSTNEFQLSFVNDAFTDEKVFLRAIRSTGINVAQLLLNQTGGNVGIGTTNAVVKLDIGGETSQFPYSIRIRNTAHATSKRAAIAFGNGASHQILIDAAGNGTEDFSIYQANVNRSPFKIEAATGNICIGKPSPQAAPTELAVNGYISESTDGGVTYHNVVTQQDIGFNANQIPLNQYLGQLAFMDEYSPTEIYNPSNTTAQLTIARTKTNGYAFIQLGKSATATQNFHLGSEGNGYFNVWNGNWGAGSGPLFTISSNGFIGIGTAGPTTQLMIHRNIDGGQYAEIVNESTGTSAFCAYRVRGSGGSVWWWINGSNRTADGGANTSTIRNDVGSLRLQSQGGGGIFIESLTGNVGINIASPTYKLHVNGSFAATTKSFVIDHPTKPGFKLRYGSLEGPENGVYIRGKLSGNNTIELPEYWTELVDENSITVNLTPIGRNPGIHSVIDIVDNTVVVESTNDIINCFFTVFAERKDVDKLITEYES